MAILAGNAASAAEVNKIFLKSSILNFCNQDKFHRETVRGFGNVTNTQSLSQELFADDGDFLFDGFGNVDNIDATNTTLVADNENLIKTFITGNNQYISHRAYICNILDNFNNSSVDAGIWTTATTNGSVTEDVTRIRLLANQNASSNASIISDGVSGFDARTFAGDSEIILNYGAVTGTSTSANIEISNGATDVNLINVVGNRSQTGTIRIVIDKDAENAYVSVDGAAFGAAIDISSVTTNWYLRFESLGGTAGTSDLLIFFTGFVDGNAATVDYVSATKTFDNTKSNVIATWDTNSTLNIDGFVSANAGSNYSAVTKDTWTAIGNTGTTAKIKLTCTIPTSIVGSPAVANIPHIKGVGGYFDG